jgi:xylan 1,4-beta-xylosidase
LRSTRLGQLAHGRLRSSRRNPAWAKGDFWAPEIIRDGGRYFVYYTARRNEGPKKVGGTLCVAVATAPVARRALHGSDGALVCQISERGGVGSIDAYFVRDEEGEPYLVWKADGNDAEPDQPTSIFAQRLSEDGTKLLGKRKEILRNTAAWERHVTEGSFIIRRGGWFYHFYSGNACCGRACEYALGVARSRKLLGPWEKYPEEPDFRGERGRGSVRATASVVEIADGRDFLLYHSYRQRRDTFSVGREAVLDEIKWGADGWPSVNEGRGPSSVAGRAARYAGRDSSAEFFEGFTSTQLGPDWQWPIVLAKRSR